MFKSQGAVQIRNNQIQFNGRHLQRGAVSVMGNEHRVEANQISHQAGVDVGVSADPFLIRPIGSTLS